MRVSLLPSLALVLAAAAPSAPDPVAGAAAALAAGEAALEHHDGPALMDAAERLARLNARPEPGTGAGAEGDLARRWAHVAVGWGVRPRTVPAWRGRLSGPGYRQLTLAAGEQFQTRQVFTGGHGARVVLAALAGGHFRLTVTGGDAAQVCRREGRGGQAACAWTPLFSEPHQITVENAEAQASRFYLVTD